MLSFVTNKISSCKYFARVLHFLCFPVLCMHAMHVSAGSHLSGFWVGDIRDNTEVIPLTLSIIKEHKRVYGCRLFDGIESSACYTG